MDEDKLAALAALVNDMLALLWTSMYSLTMTALATFVQVLFAWPARPEIL